MPKNLKEISLKTIKSYKSKAEIANAGNSRNAAANDKMAKKAAAKGDSEAAMGHLGRAKTKRLSIQKRTKGLEMANKKLGEGTYDTFRQDKIDKYGTRYKESSSFKQGHETERKRIKKQFGKDSKSYRNHMKDAMQSEENINERGLSPAEKRDKEDYVKGMKKNKTEFMKRYGRDAEGVMYATATKMAQEETINELDKDTLKSYVGKAQAQRLDNIDKMEKQSKRGEHIIAKTALGKVRKRGLGIRQAQKKLGEAEYDSEKPKRGIQKKRVNLQFGRQQRYKPTPFKKDQQQDLYKKDDSLETKIKKSRENKRFPDYRQNKDTGQVKKEFLPGGEHAKKYGGLKNKKTSPTVTQTSESIIIKQLKTLIKENFQDGKNPEDKGDSKRHGLSGKQSTSSLKKVRSSDSASPRKKQLAHWILNMRKGRNKKK